MRDLAKQLKLRHTHEIIGNHVMILGDCIKIMQQFPESSVDFIFADSPYGHNNNNVDLISRRERALGKPLGNGPETRPIMNDGKEAWPLFCSAICEYKRILRKGCCCCCCCCGGGPDPQFARWSLVMDESLKFKQMIVWDKGKMGLGWHYRRSYETILVAQKPGARCEWYDRTHRIENIIRPGDYGIRKIVPNSAQHPTEKPAALAEHFIRLHTRAGAIVLDPFSGSGSTGEACVRSGRRFIGIELDPHWYSVSVARLRAAVRDADERN